MIACGDCFVCAVFLLPLFYENLISAEMINQLFNRKFIHNYFDNELII